MEHTHLLDAEKWERKITKKKKRKKTCWKPVVNLAVKHIELRFNSDYQAMSKHICLAA